MKIKLTAISIFEVYPKNYPEGVETIEQIIEHEKSQDLSELFDACFDDCTIAIEKA